MCRQTLEDRYAFLRHKLRDLSQTLQTHARRRRETQLLYQRARHLRGVAENVFQTALSIDGLIDSIVTLGVMKQAERALALSIATECAATLMDRIAISMGSISEESEVLAAPLIEANPDEKEEEPLSSVLVLPEVPTHEPRALLPKTRVPVPV